MSDKVEQNTILFRIHIQFCFTLHQNPYTNIVLFKITSKSKIEKHSFMRDGVLLEKTFYSKFHQSLWIINSHNMLQTKTEQISKMKNQHFKLQQKYMAQMDRSHFVCFFGDKPPHRMKFFALDLSEP